MKKILIITLEFPPQIGGIATYIEQMCKQMEGKNIVVLAPKTKNTEDWDKSQPYKIIRENLLFPLFLWPRWIKLCFIARKISKAEKIDVAMIHHVLPSGYACLFLKKLLNITFLVFSHGSDTQIILQSKWKKLMVSMVLDKAEGIIFNSNFLRNKFLEVYPNFESKSIVVYPCPEEEFFTPPSDKTIDEMRNRYALAGKKVILSVGRMCEGKGFPHIIRLLPRILENNPNIVWLVIGGGPKKNEFVNLLKSNYLQNIVRYIGEVPHTMIKPYYYLADLFVLLTHTDEGRDEGLGQVFLEAAAAGLPIVAGKSGGVEEAVGNRINGFVFDVRRDAAQIIKTISELLINKEHLVSMGEMGKQRMRSEFRWTNQLDKLAKWIE